jgi:hypothetical protein
MGLHRQLLEERAEEEQYQGAPLHRMQALGSKVLVRRLEDPKGRPGYAADLSMMHRLLKEALAMPGRACGSGT